MKAALVVACAIVTADAPLRVTDVSPVYCAQREKIGMVLRNVSGTMLKSSISVDRVDDSGRWQEYSADVLAKEAFPRKVTALRFAKKESRRVEWRPRASSNEHGLREGRYRIVANVLFNGLPPGRRFVVAHFIVRDAAQCESGDPEPMK